MELSLDTKKRYTYADYMTWQDNQRRELLNGLIHILPSGESTSHQRISGNLLYRLYNIIKHKSI